jgi:hypothetical protein
MDIKNFYLSRKYSIKNEEDRFIFEDTVNQMFIDCIEIINEKEAVTFTDGLKIGVVATLVFEIIIFSVVFFATK